MFTISELTYSHKIKLDDDYLTFELRDAIEKVRVFYQPVLCTSFNVCVSICLL